jgi:hypothetical protein
MLGRVFRPRARLATVFLISQVLAGAWAGNTGAADLPLPPGCEVAGASKPAAQARVAVPPVFPPVQVQVRTPVEPTVLPSGGRNYLIYELHLHNFTTEPLTVQGIEVIDADQPAVPAVAELKEAQVSASLRKVTIGGDEGDSRRLGVGEGNSGDARWPHLHFQVTDKADAMASEGMPQLFDRYRIKAGEQEWAARTGDYPMGEVVIDFGPDTEDK